MVMVAAAVRLMMKKGMSWEPGAGSPEKTAHMRPPRKGPSARTPLARLCAVPFTAPRLEGGANLFTMACTARASHKTVDSMALNCCMGQTGHVLARCSIPALAGADT